MLSPQRGDLPQILVGRLARAPRVVAGEAATRICCGTRADLRKLERSRRGFFEM